MLEICFITKRYTNLRLYPEYYYYYYYKVHWRWRLWTLIACRSVNPVSWSTTRCRTLLAAAAASALTLAVHTDLVCQSDQNTTPLTTATPYAWPTLVNSSRLSLPSSLIDSITYTHAYIIIVQLQNTRPYSTCAWSGHDVKILSLFTTLTAVTGGGGSPAFVCLSVCLFFRTISQKAMQLTSPNIYSTMSPGNPFMSGSKGQKSRSRVTNTVPGILVRSVQARGITLNWFQR